MVQSAVENLHGTVDVTFQPGQGTQFIMRVPLTLTTIRNVLVQASGQTYAVATSSVEQLVRFSGDQVGSMGGHNVLLLGITPIPISTLVEVLDIQMPVMNGFEATREIMIASPRPIIIMSASTQAADSENAMRALKAGALTVIAKPVGPYSARYQQAAQQLIETVKMMAEVKVIRRRRPFHPDGKAIGPSAARPQAHARIIAMAASTGGPPALQSVLSGLPASFPAPILVVQHLAVGFMPGLASWLDASLALSVKIAEDAEVLLPGQVYIAPENCHLGATPRGTAMLSDAPAIDGFRPSANFLFESVAKSFAAEVLAVILTGMGRDGVQGLRALHSAGGKVLAQDPLSCIVNGMPGAAVAAKVVHHVLSLEEIAKTLQTSTKQIC